MGEEDLTYRIDQKAYIKLILHALKHKASAVNGILIGRLSNNTSLSSSSSSSSSLRKDENLVSSSSSVVVEIVDAVPVSHSQIGLLPTLEIALLQAEEYFSSEGLNVVGYFHGNERYDDLELGKIANKIGDYMARYFSQPLVLLLDNKKLQALSKSIHKEPVMQLHVKDPSKGWRQAKADGSSGKLLLKQPTANAVLWDFISSEKYNEIADFDDYLDDIRKDWLNSKIFV